MEATAQSGGRDASIASDGAQHPNVNMSERQLSLAAGMVLIGCGLLRPGGLRSLIVTGLGAALAYRGATGHCHFYEALGISTQPSDEVVDSAGGESALDSESETEFKKNQLDKERFEKLKTAQMDRGRDEDRAIEVAAEEVKELRRREGRSKDDEKAFPDESDKVWERK